MPKNILYLLIAVLIISCTQNVWKANGLLRPKKPKFSILNEPFTSNALIDTKHIYISTNRSINYDNNKLITTYGFYTDGKFIVNGFYESTIDSLIHYRASWDSAARIGYYTTKNDKIKSQYFEQYGGGEYINMQGIIRKDTILIVKKYRGFILKTGVRYDTLIKSKYLLR